jgi:protein-disulfide isomerase
MLTSVLWALLVPIISSSAEPPESIFSRGSGPIEILVFTDYFCPPCQTIEPYMESALADLDRLGARITFIDKPIHRMSPLYSKYFLYAAKPANNLAEILHIRGVLSNIAKTKAVHSEPELIQKLKESNIKLVLLDVKPIFDRWVQLIERFGVRSTPTCIVRRPGKEMSVFTGSRGIRKGIDLLLKELSEGS